MELRVYTLKPTSLGRLGQPSRRIGRFGTFLKPGPRVDNLITDLCGFVFGFVWTPEMLTNKYLKNGKIK